MKISTTNFDSKWMDIDGNIAKMESDIKSILKIDSGVDTIVFPELNTSGYILDDGIKSIAQTRDGELIGKIKDLSQQYNVNLIGGFIEKGSSNFYNSAFVTNRYGELVAIYRKNHLFTQSDEPKLYTPGDGIRVFELDGLKCGIYICFDIRYPRLFEAYKQKGVDLLFGIYAWPKGRSKKEIFRFLIQTRAHENQFFITAVDQSGEDRNSVYEANHLSVNPLGEEIGYSVEKYNFVEIDRAMVNEIEDILPLKDGWKKDYLN